MIGLVRLVFAERRPLARVRGLFLSGLGLVYLCAFVSLWSQVEGLIGPDGIVPVGDALDWAEGQGHGPLRFPTLLWLGFGARALDLLCGGGVLLSIAVVLGFLRLPCLALLWAFYLSLFTACIPFMHFQWDTLLLESGFLAIFLAPWSATPWGARGHEASALGIWAQRYLVFRLMLASGVVKLTAGDASWWPDLTALTFHYETQPLPAWTSWHVHHLPASFHKAEVLGTFAIELLVPLLVFLGRLPRLIAFFCFAGLQLTIALTGNYGFFNLLTAVLSLTLLDDAMLPWGKAAATAPPPRWTVQARRCALAPLLVLATLEFSAGLGFEPWPRFVERARAEVDPFRLTSSYGLFRVMTKERREIVVEGSRDREHWEPYEFRWKPGDPDRAPAFTGPHMPRLDWQMWFAALSSFERTWWFSPFLARLLDNEPAVVALLARNPFEGAPPRYIRATVYRYEFTTAEERRVTGTWWKRTELGPYTPVLSRR